MQSIVRILFVTSVTLALVGGVLMAGETPADPTDSIGGQSPTQEPPRIVVLLVVDQLRADLLDRYDGAFTGGLRRLQDGGYRFVNATHDHAITETAPGHATIATGTMPAKHGVVSNDWWEEIDGQARPILNVIDPTTPLLDDPSLAGASPGVLERSGLGEWMQRADPATRVVSLSAKDRAAVLLGAHSDAQVYWFGNSLGRFVTSTYYRDSYPDWIERFNQDVMPGLAGDSVWRLEVPEAFRGLANADSAVYEGDGVHSAFPHAFGESTSTDPDLPFWEWWASTPPLDRATLLLAREAVEHEQLGDDDVPDLLAISLSQTDRVGHAYGPRSLEQLDNLIRLDRELGTFLEWLDERVGPGGYLLALTADHGVMDHPEERVAEGLSGVRLNTDSVLPLQRILDRVSGERSPGEDLARGLAEALPTVSWVDRAWTRSELEMGPPEPDSFTRLQLNGYFPGRLGGLLSRAGVELQLDEGVLTWSMPRGTTHGSPFFYDRHVPLILYGSGIVAGESEERTSIADLAPTLAALLGIAAPTDLDGVARRTR